MITGISNDGSVAEVNGEYTAPEGFEGEVICQYTITDGEGDSATGDADGNIIIVIGGTA